MFQDVGFKRFTAIALLTTLLITATGGAALARQGGQGGPGSGEPKGHKVSEQFKDMDGYNWGLGEVVRLMVKGVFKGRSETEFAPGAAITRQEMAVATVRLIGREAEAQALPQEQVDLLLSQMNDASAIADWAQPSVALLIQLEAIETAAPYRPAEEATRLDVAVLLVRVLGYGPEAESKMDAPLNFTDSDAVPTELRGYVAAAVDHGLIKGYDNGSFQPERAVKRVEMAVMMGRADRQIGHNRPDEPKGSVTGVSPEENSLTIQVGEEMLTVTLAPEAAVFIDQVEGSLADIAVGMQVELKLNGNGLAIFVEARSQSDTP